ncbi:MAG: hypothetical protein LBR78_01670 [Holosporales bacterium]|nr:hypothetical protein [Holosporales bacterium]
MVERGAVEEHVAAVQGVVARQAHRIGRLEELVESYERLSRRTCKVLARVEAASQATPVGSVPVAPLLDEQLIAKMRADIMLDENSTPPLLRVELMPLMMGMGSNLRPDREMAEGIPQWEWEANGAPITPGEDSNNHRHTMIIQRYIGQEEGWSMRMITNSPEAAQIAGGTNHNRGSGNWYSRSVNVRPVDATKVAWEVALYAQVRGPDICAIRPMHHKEMRAREACNLIAGIHGRAAIRLRSRR